ncbi:MAG TPA: APH(3') family aminoglycoside O-phosphotransferase [Devosia sp.]|jgi:aminoglycoside 3'-phosphotransferase-2|uniref:APH(3') family aminoglycoside O-phosphotransferase n=1 Tax=Devosia sp. TaxID=1871048 RepID=UPI002F94025F
MSSSLSPDLPLRLVALASREWSRVTIGKSQAAVWRLEAPGETLFLKSAPRHCANPLDIEVDRLAWLATTGLPCPAVLDFVEGEDTEWLLMSAVAGADLTTMVERPEALCAIMADALRRLHQVDLATCPFDHRLDRKLGMAERNFVAGWVDESDFDDEHQGWSAGQVLDWVKRNRPDEAHLVVAHGDACLPNIMALDGAVSGFVDCGRLGIADPWQDLALACRSIASNCGKQYVQHFLARYGAEWSADRNRYYATMDNLF